MEQQQVSVQELFAIIGDQTVQLAVLRRQIAELSKRIASQPAATTAPVAQE